MHLTEIIKKPILTEKSYTKIAENVYTFKVAKKANKVQIKKAFEKIFEVKIEKINIMNCRPKAKRVGRYLGKTSGYKKAIIKLKPGETLDLFDSDSKSKK